MTLKNIENFMIVKFPCKVNKCRACAENVSRVEEPATLLFFQDKEVF